MIAEILSIGTELLMGQIANTDAQYISRRLALKADEEYDVYEIDDLDDA